MIIQGKQEYIRWQVISDIKQVSGDNTHESGIK